MDLCDTRRLPTVGDLNTQFPIGRFWRFQVTKRGRGQSHVTRDTCPAQVLADPTVSMFGSRDIDSYLTAREAAAVSAWRVSGKQWHVMRDGPFHRSTVLAGLWGGANYENMTEAARVKQLLTGVQPNTYKFYDQRILHGRVWPVIRDRAAIYDSYNCGMVWKFGHCRAWPTRRYPLLLSRACSADWCVVLLQGGFLLRGLRPHQELRGAGAAAEALPRGLQARGAPGLAVLLTRTSPGTQHSALKAMGVEAIFFAIWQLMNL